MALPNYPNNPSVNDTFVNGGVTFQWDGEKWKALSNANNSLTAQLADPDSTVLIGGVEAGKLVSKFSSVVEMKNTNLAEGVVVGCSSYYEGGSLTTGLQYKIVAPQVVDEVVDHTLSNGNVAKLLHNGTITLEQAGADGTVANDTAAMAAIQTKVNAGLIHHLITNGDHILNAGYTFTADNFTHSGNGSIKTDPALVVSPGDGIDLARYTGDNTRVIGLLFDGSSDNSTSGNVTPTFTLVEMAGANAYWDARTKDSGAYALDMTGKNPTCARHIDENSMYSMVRFFPQEEWDYCRVGLVAGDRVSSVAGASGRGIIFNGTNVINQITIDQYRSKNRGILADGAAGGQNKTGYYKNMHIKSLVQRQEIDSGAPSTEGTKLENVENLTIDYCEITHDDSAIADFEALKLTDTLGSVKIGTLKVTGRNKIPTGIPVNIDLFMYSGAVVGNQVIEAADNDAPTYWNFGHIYFDTPTVANSSKGVINHNTQGGNITIWQYNEVNEAFALMRCSLVQRNLYTVHAVGFTEFVNSSFEESVTQIPRQVISSDFGNMSGRFERGDIAWRQNQSTGSTAMQICTTAGDANTTAVLRDALNIS